MALLAKRKPLRVTFELPADDSPFHILDECSGPLRLPGPFTRKVVGRKLAEVSFWIPQQADIYRALVRCLAKINRWCLAHWSFPPLYESGIRYAYEPHGAEVWQSIPALYLSRFGDCEDLVAARIAELPGAEPLLVKTGRTPSGGRLFHVVLKRADGSIEDPSTLLGME